MKSAGIVTLILVIVGLILIGPFFSILALNHLFGTGIEITFTSWLAMAWVHMIIAGAKSSSSK